jgi:hypothetical protein
MFDEFNELPWKTRPQTLEQVFVEIEWKGGVLRIPRLGYMVADELAELAKIDPKNAGYRLTLQHSNTLAQATELSPRLCYSVLAKAQLRELGQNVDYTEQEAGIIITMNELVNNYLDEYRAILNRIRIRAVSIILQRIVPGWPEEKTRKLPEPLIDQIFNFQQEEERGLDTAIDPEADAMEKMKALEEDLGKLQEASQLTATAQTGHLPTGNASDSGQAPQNLPAKVSGDSPAPTSSKRSRPATKTSEKGFTEKSLASPNSRGSKRKSTATVT